MNRPIVFLAILCWVYAILAKLDRLSAGAYVLGAVAILVAVLDYRAHRPIPPGHCQCGYDLTGNVSGRCPECGTAFRFSSFTGAVVSAESGVARASGAGASSQAT